MDCNCDWKSVFISDYVLYYEIFNSIWRNWSLFSPKLRKMSLNIWVLISIEAIVEKFNLMWGYFFKFKQLNKNPLLNFTYYVFNYSISPIGGSKPCPQKLVLGHFKCLHIMKLMSYSYNVILKKTSIIELKTLFLNYPSPPCLLAQKPQNLMIFPQNSSNMLD